MNIVLCGMMGSGKTTVAAELHGLYSLEWTDTDEEIVKRHGEINKIFADFGEARFRDMESEVVKDVSSRCENAVISLGGGCVLRAANVTELKKNGKIFYLRTQPETIISRICGDTSRPLLQGGLEQKVRSISAARSAVYEQAADYIIDTDALTPAEIAQKIMEIAGR